MMQHELHYVIRPFQDTPTAPIIREQNKYAGEIYSVIIFHRIIGIHRATHEGWDGETDNAYMLMNGRRS